MTLKELRSALQAILEAEQAANVDWHKIERLCRRTLGHLNREPAPDYTDDFVRVFSKIPNFGKTMGTTLKFSASG